MKTKKIFKIVLTLSCLLFLAQSASAACVWVSYSKCSDINSNWSLASKNSYCPSSKPTGSDKCCCGPDYYLGCCVKDQSGEITTENIIASECLAITYAKTTFIPGATAKDNRCWNIDNSSGTITSTDVTPTSYTAAPIDKTSSNTANKIAEPTYTPLNYTPQIQIPVPGSGLDKTSIPVGFLNDQGEMTSDLLAKYIKAIYDYGMMIAGILAAIVLMGGGLLWLTSAGNDSRITQAKELITGSIVGLAILFSSWIILNTINPDLLNLREIKTKLINQVTLGCCQSNSSAQYTSSAQCQGTGQTFYSDRVINSATNACEKAGCCIGRNTAGDLVNPECVPSFAGNCQNTFEAGDCQNVCPQYYKIVDCNNVSDGGHCNNSINSYCYGGLGWTGDGKKNEPCGRDSDGRCMVANLIDGSCPDPYHLSGFLGFGTSGRDCEMQIPRLACCHNHE